MTSHLLLPLIKLEDIEIITEYKEWLDTWVGNLEDEIENGNVASSWCLQGLINEIVLNGRPQTDWLGIMDEHLMNQDVPLAYSEGFGNKLYKFNQWHQTPVHAVHTRWWIENVIDSSKVNRHYGNIIENFIQSNGQIYNPKVSETGLRTRMKAEFMMSLAMGTEILESYGLLNRERKKVFEGILCSEPRTMYLSAEYFRCSALFNLTSSVHLELGPVISNCEAGKGYCDFSMDLKVDDYMGTAKRSQRDVAVHSPLMSLYAYYLSNCSASINSDDVIERLRTFGGYLKDNPFDIPAFKIRDLDIPFGTDVTPLEVIAASYIISMS